MDISKTIERDLIKAYGPITGFIDTGTFFGKKDLLRIARGEPCEQ